MKHDWYIVPNFLTSEECDDIVSTYSKMEKIPAVVGKEVDAKEEMRRSNIVWIEDMELQNKLAGLFIEANESSFGFSLHPYKLLEMQFTEYDESYRGHYKEHIDSRLLGKSFPYSDRKLSVVVQLTDKNSYEGGNFELFCLPSTKWVSIEGFENRGAALVFPSFYPHKVTPVTKGTRNSLVSWIQGDHFK